MANKQKENLSGFPWHIGFVTMDDFDSRRDKRRCIYYVNEKESESIKPKKNYCKIAGMRCKGSSHCSDYREVDEKPPKPSFRPKLTIVSLPCSIPLATEIHTIDKKVGFLVKYKGKIMTLLINGKECNYPYPQAFEEGYLKVTPEIEKCIRKDKSKAVWK